MPREPLRPPELRGRVFLGRAAVADGLLTVEQLRSRAWRRLLRGVYVDVSRPVDHGVLIAAAALIMPAAAAISGRSAAWWYGARDLAATDDRVEVTVPEAQRFGPVKGLRIRRVDEWSRDDVERHRGVATTSRARTAYDIARQTPGLADAVAALDLLSHTGVLRPSELARATSHATHRPGAARARRALALVDGRAESMPESRLRLGLIAGGLPPPVPQYEVRVGGRFVARVDLAYPDLRIAIEYDGAWHGAPGQLARDRRRLNALVAAGWRVIHVTAADLYDLSGVIAWVQAARAA